MSKVIANTSARPIYGNYKDGNSQSRVLLQPGLNEVKNKVFKALLKESGFRRMIDNKVLSVSKADLKEVEEQMQDDGGKEKAKPQATGNQKNDGAPLSKTSDEAVDKAVKKPAAKK